MMWRRKKNSVTPTATIRELILCGLRRLCAAALTTIVTGCSLGPAFQHPETNSPTAWRSESGREKAAWPEADWWRGFGSAQLDTPILILAALVAVYLILGMLYESTIHPITIISTLPSAGLGALLTLMLFGMPLDVIGIIGIILLIGIVKKNGIMLVDFALQGQRERGLNSEEAIHEACRLRFPPILMATLCALLAGVPLMLGTGTVSEIRQPLGYAMVGGLLVSQLLTLFTTPVVYIYMDRLNGWLKRHGQGGHARAASATE